MTTKTKVAETTELSNYSSSLSGKKTILLFLILAIVGVCSPTIQMELSVNKHRQRLYTIQPNNTEHQQWLKAANKAFLLGVETSNRAKLAALVKYGTAAM